MFGKVIREELDDELKCWLELPIHHGGIHNMDIWYSEVSARIYCVDVAMGIGTLVLFIGKI
jgi:hypothetical protein